MQRAAELLPAAPLMRALAPARPGIVAAVDARALGLAIIDLGGGRRRVEDSIDYAVGLSEVAAIGESVGGEHPLCVIHAAGEADLERAAAAITAAITIGDEAPVPAPVVRQRVGPPPV
jgi:thymidine phosphorylase